MRIRRALVLVAGLILMGIAPAEATTGEEWLRLKIVSELRGPATFASVEAAMSRYFDEADLELKGVSKQSYEKLAQIERARSRAQEIARVMTFDLDGKGYVTREDLEIGLSVQARASFQQRGLAIEPTREQFVAVRDRLMAPYLADDFRKDGKITLDEMQRAADEKLGNRQTPESEHIPLDLSPRGDEVVTREDYEAAIRRVFNSFHPTHDGVVSQEEAEAASASVEEIMLAESKQRREAAAVIQLARILPKCGIPKASADAVVDRVTTVSGTGMSNITLGASNEPASVADLIVPSGASPVYLSLDSDQPVLWRVAGAVERVEAVVVAGLGARSDEGVIGVTREKVHIVTDGECLAQFWRQRMDHSTKLMSMAFGKSPAKTIDDFRTGIVRFDGGKNDTTSLLAGARTAPQNTNARFAWARFLSAWPGGLVMVDPATVTASVAPKKSARRSWRRRDRRTRQFRRSRAGRRNQLRERRGREIAAGVSDVSARPIARIHAERRSRANLSFHNS